MTEINASALEGRARYLLNISVFIRNPEKYDEVRREAQELLDEAERLRERDAGADAKTLE